MGETRAPIILCRKGGAGTVRNHGRVPQPELKMTFAETVEERNVLAQRPITLEIIISANKRPRISWQMPSNCFLLDIWNLSPPNRRISKLFVIARTWLCLSLQGHRCEVDKSFNPFRSSMEELDHRQLGQEHRLRCCVTLVHALQAVRGVKLPAVVTLVEPLPGKRRFAFAPSSGDLALLESRRSRL